MENEIRNGNEVNVEAKIRNPNHPQKGDNTRVDPIRRLEDVQAIKKLLSDNPRALLLFTMGINNGLRAGDLLRLKVKDVKYLKEVGSIVIKESKTDKENTLMVNKPVYKALRNYFEKMNPGDDEFLFSSRKGNKRWQSSG